MSTFDFCKTLESRVKAKEDYVLSCRVGDFSKPMALEARYHSQCHKKYLKKSVPTSSASSLHDSAFDDLISKIKPELEDGTVFDKCSRCIKNFLEIICPKKMLKNTQIRN